MGTALQTATWTVTVLGSNRAHCRPHLITTKLSNNIKHNIS